MCIYRGGSRTAGIRTRRKICFEVKDRIKTKLLTLVNYSSLVFWLLTLNMYLSTGSIYRTSIVKVELSISKNICFVCFNESPLEMMKNG